MDPKKDIKDDMVRNSFIRQKYEKQMFLPGGLMVYFSKKKKKYKETKK